jgi:hypothetical protein
MATREELVKAMLAPPRRTGPSPYARPDASGFNTQLQPLDEMAFRQWVNQNKVPFNPEAATSDYDMRGFYRGMQQQHPRATSAVDPYDKQLHYPDWWKTPTHESFSQDSQWAGPIAPRWNQEGSQMVSPGGRIMLDFTGEEPR